MNCKIAGEQLNAHLNIKDFQKVESLIKRIAEASEEPEKAAKNITRKSKSNRYRFIWNC